MSIVISILLFLSHCTSSFILHTSGQSKFLTIMSTNNNKRKKGGWQEKKLRRKEQNIPQFRKEWDAPHPGSYATEDLKSFTKDGSSKEGESEDVDPSLLNPKKKVALLLVTFQKLCPYIWDYYYY